MIDKESKKELEVYDYILKQESEAESALRTANLFVAYKNIEKYQGAKRCQ